jgi:LysM repeat protein
MPQSPVPADPSSSDGGLTRRGLLIGGVALVLTACARATGRTEGIDGTWYGVQSGDSLSSLSRRSGLTVEAIVDANGLTGSELTSGQRLWFPGVRRLASDPLARPVGPPPEPKPVAKPDLPEPPAGGYEIVPRSAWTSDPIGPNHTPMGKVQRLTVHHTDEHSGMDGLSDLEVIRRIEKYHRGPEKRWAAIGYHFLVGKDGRIYEGRPVRYQGAHTSANNENNIGVSVIGDCHRHLPSKRQLQALAAFLDDLRKRYGLSLNQVYGHRDLKPTVCPGDALYGWLKAYRSGRL